MEKEKLIIETSSEIVEFPDDEIRGVWYGNQKISDLRDLMLKMDSNGEESAKSTRSLVRGFGKACLCFTLVTIGLGSWLIHAENKDQVMLEAIYDRINAVEASPFKTGQVVHFKAFDGHGGGSDMRKVISASGLPHLNAQSMKHDGYINCKGEILDHWQDESGSWFATVTLGGVFGTKNEWTAAAKKVTFVVPESRLKTANDQTNDMHKKASNKTLKRR